MTHVMRVKRAICEHYQYALQALKILADDVQCDVVKIGGIIRNKAS